jgi:hypothetical protein
MARILALHDPRACVNAYLRARTRRPVATRCSLPRGRSRERRLGGVVPIATVGGGARSPAGIRAHLYFGARVPLIPDPLFGAPGIHDRW